MRLENDRMRQVNVRQNEDDEHRKIRLINNRVRIRRIYNIAGRTITDEIPATHNIGLLTTVCPHCDAFSFHHEKNLVIRLMQNIFRLMQGSITTLLHLLQKKHAAPFRQSRSTNILHFWENGILLRCASSKS